MSVRSLFLTCAVVLTACQQTPEAQAAPPSTPASPYVHHKISASGYDVTPLSGAEVAKLARSLTTEQRNVLLKAGTEPPFCGGHLDNKKNPTTLTLAVQGGGHHRGQPAHQSGVLHVHGAAQPAARLLSAAVPTRPRFDMGGYQGRLHDDQGVWRMQRLDF